jgi:hypothetical protein
MQRGEVARCPEAGGLQPVDTNCLAGSERIRKDQFLVLRIKPGPGHQVCGRSRADLFSEFGEVAMILRGENPLLDA